MNGMDATTGKSITGTSHLNQSLQKLFTTYTGERVMRRYLGVDPSIIDRPAVPSMASAYTYSLASALDDAKEKRFSLEKTILESVDSQGRFSLLILGKNLEESGALQQLIKFS